MLLLQPTIFTSAPGWVTRRMMSRCTIGGQRLTLGSPWAKVNVGEKRRDCDALGIGKYGGVGPNGGIIAGAAGREAAGESTFR